MRAALLLLPCLLSIPLAAADEAAPDCEDEFWVGWLTTEPVRQAYAAAGSPGGARSCEGEHWDGQDSVGEGVCDASVCMGPDPNEGGEDLLDPLGVRASKGEKEAYGAADVVLVGRLALYVGECREGSACVAAYTRDNTPSNAVTALFRPLSITRPVPSESDCDQETYRAGALSGDPTRCGRDNTAITLELLMP